MQSPIHYKEFIQKYFKIKNKAGVIVPFILNSTQSYYYDLLKGTYPEMTNIRENVLKARREGMSSFWEAIFTTDFILGTIGLAPIMSGQIVSHKDSETKPHFQRVDLFLNSYLHAKKIERKDFLEVDNNTSYMRSKTGPELFIGSAGAKVVGRGGDTLNLLFTEVGFYPNTPIINAEELVTGAEQQVPMGMGKIIRESTGNVVGDFFYDEWYRGISEWCSVEEDKMSLFHSRFFPWFMHKEYQIPCPPGFKFLPNELEVRALYKLNSDQLYWYHKKKKTIKDMNKFRREYPNSPLESFLSGGSCFFDLQALNWYLKKTKKAIQTGFLAPDGQFI